MKSLPLLDYNNPLFNAVCLKREAVEGLYKELAGYCSVLKVMMYGDH